MRRVLAAGCVVAALATASADDMAPSAGAVVHLHRDERPARNDAEAITWGADGERYSALESLASSLLAATRDAEKSRWRATVTAVRVLPRASGAARIAAATRPIADAADLAALRESIADRDAFVEHRVEASGPCGATRHAADGASTAVRIHDDDDSAVGGSVVWSIAAAAESGLDVRIETAPSGDGRWRTHVVAVWSGSPDRARADWLVEEDVDRVRVPVFAADVVFDVRGGETAVLRAIDASGAARLVLVRIDGDAPDVPMVRDHEGGWLVAPVDLVRDPEGPTAWPVEGGPPIHSDDEARAALLTPEACRTEWRQGAIGLFRAALLTGAATDGTADDLRAALALRRGAGAVEVARPAGPRVVLPAAPGTLFRAFAGTIETMRRNVSTIPACEDCLLVRTEVGVEAFGVGASGCAWPDGTADVEIVERVLLTEANHDAIGRRGLAGHRTTEPFAVRLPLRRIRETSFGGCVAPNAPRIGNEFTVQFDAPDAVRGRADPWAAKPPIDVRVGAGHLPLRPGRTGRFVERTLRGFVRQWDSEGWCGMRARFPLANDVVEGADVRLALDTDARSVDVFADVRGAPEVLGRVDPLDGAVTIVRSPFLRYAAERVVPPEDGRIARAGSLVLRVAVSLRLGAEPGEDVGPAETARRPARVDVGADAGFTAPVKSRTVFECGGETVLPTEQDGYSSNHETGEVVSGFRAVLDGTRATLGPTDDDGTRRLDVEFRSPPAWTQRVLTKSTVPAREGETESGLVYVRRAVRRASFLVVPGRGFRRVASGALDLPEIAVAADASPEGDRP